MIQQLHQGQSIQLRKQAENSLPIPLTHFCIGVQWGAIEVKKKRFLRPAKITRQPVDLDLSCLIQYQGREEPFDYLYSPEYKPKTLTRIGLPPGKLISEFGGLEHSGDDQTGDLTGESLWDNEVVTVNLELLDPAAVRIYFFLNNLGPEDFEHIPYVRMRIYEGNAVEVVEEYATYSIHSSPLKKDHRAAIMGKMEKEPTTGEWTFTALGETTDDANFAATIFRIRAGLQGTEKK